MEYREPNSGLVIDVGPGRAVREYNRVLRNTYALLALSLLPTIAGAWFGLYSGIQLRGALGVILFLAVAIGFQVLIYRNRNSAAGVYLLLGFCAMMGWMTSNLLAWVLRFSNGAELLMMALGGTALIMVGMTAIATTVKRNLSNFGQFMFIGMLILLGAMLLNLFFQIPALTLTILVGMVLVFSGLLVFDVNRVVTGGETNYVLATMAIYLDLLNIFTALLQLLGIFSGRSE